jgi:hypothetical protein
LLTEEANIQKLVDEFNEVLTMACNKIFQIHRTSRNAPSHRSVRRWSAALTVLRKRTNALRRLYLRTRNNEELREKGKHNISNVTRYRMALLKGKKLDPVKSTVMCPQPLIPGAVTTN